MARPGGRLLLVGLPTDDKLVMCSCYMGFTYIGNR